MANITEKLEQDFKPREYQICLYEKAIEQNCIIYLPTGSGKTYIAVLLVKKLSFALHKPYNLDGKRTIFIVNTVALVHQQCAFLSRHTGLTCKGYSGDMDVDFWSNEEWKQQIEINHVLVMTAQIFLDLLLRGIMTLSKVNLLIFDECHRAVKDHPMRQIMQRFENCPIDQQPRILAMSATLLNANVKIAKIEQTLKELEITLHSKICTVESLSIVENFSTNPREIVKYYTPPEPSNVLNRVNEIIENAKNILEVIEIPSKMANNNSSDIFQPTSKNTKIKRILSDITEHINEMGLYGALKSILLHLIQLEYIKKYSDEKEVNTVLEFVMTQLMKIQKLLSHEIDDSDTENIIYKYSSSKVLKLIEVLKSFYENQKDNQKFCCIIFVQRRFTAKVLYHILKKLSISDKNFEFLRPEFMVGQNNDPYKNPREALCVTKWNKETLDKFRNGTSNCIVATDVIDEGVDIPSCTLIVRYYAPMDFRAYIQSKGRARHSTSHFIILASNNDDYITRYQSFQAIEKYLKKALHGKTDYRSKPDEDLVNQNLYNYEIEPYVITNSNGITSVITEQSAISLINTYCAKLVKSKFIMLTPTWVKEETQTENGPLYQVFLTLPPVSPLKEIVSGNKMTSISSAKRSAALKTCVALYNIGELDINLLPRKVEDSIHYAQHLFPYMEDENKTETEIPGTHTKKRRHEKIHAEALFGAYPKVNEALYLHVIEMKPNYPRPVNDNRHLIFYNLLEGQNTYGILSTKRMPEIPQFPIFMNVGELQVHINVNNETKTLSQTEIESLKTFHTLLFNSILGVIKEFMVFDVQNMDNSFLIVPVNENHQIDWDIVKQYKTISSISPTKPLDVSSNYELALVTPNYRASNVYIVTQVCEYLTANSSFPTPDFFSYVHYFKNRHDLVIENVKQPMLEVKPISKKINCIKPRNIKAGLSRRKRANLTEDFEEHLVPELCERIDFPAFLWLKGTTLPSILYRVTQLVVAEDLRNQIEIEASLNLQTSMQVHQWNSLKIEEQGRGLENNTDPINEESILEEDNEEVHNLTSLDMSFNVDILSQEKNLYSWTKEQEPPDLDRCADRIQLIDIEYYYRFMSDVKAEDIDNLKKQNAVKSKYKRSEKMQEPLLKMLEGINQCGPSPVDILKGLTTKMSHDAFDFERVETLGDSLLKFAVSLYLFQAYPNFGEGQLTFLKGKLVGNLNLYYCGKQKNIPGRMNTEEFSPLCNYITPAYTVTREIQKLLVEEQISPNILYEFRISPEERLKGKLSNNTSQIMLEKILSWPTTDDPSLQTGMEPFLGIQVVSDKSVSDCVEALIGTYLLNLGLEGALKILAWFEILPKTLNISEFLYSTIPDPKLASGNIDEHMPWADMIENNLGYKFNNRGFLLQAFTHASYTKNRITDSYQRLEFLGDAILDFLLTVHIYETCGDLSPGELTDLRSALVNNITFACLATRYGLHTALLAYAPKIFDMVDRFVKFQEDRNYEVNDELLWILLEEDECNMAEHVDVPKVLGDLYESVIGAIFLDSGKNLKTVWNVVYSLMKREIDLFSKNVPKQPVRVIHESQGADPKFSKSTVVPESSTVMITLSINVNGKRKCFHGFGSTKKLAKCAAAKQAIKYLRYKN